MAKKLLRCIELSSLDYYTHHISPQTIRPKMTKSFSKLNLTKLVYHHSRAFITLKMTKLFFKAEF